MGLRRPFAQTCRLYNRLVHLLKLLPERRRPFSVLRGSCLAESEVMSRRFGSLSEVLRRP
jgi:hypothetical protein